MHLISQFVHQTFDLITMIKDKESIKNTVKDMYSRYMDLGKKKKMFLLS